MQVYIISDRSLRPDLALDDLIAMMAGAGADMIQIREKDLPAVAVLSCARQARRNGASVFVNARADIALAAGASGVHLPAAGVEPASVRNLWGSRLRIGVSTHNINEANAAMAGGADFIT